MPRTVTDDFAHWSKAATKGLPSDIAALVRGEFEAHYADAIRDYRAGGMSESEAHLAAIADLGDAKAAAQALRETHLSTRRYIVAMFLSLVYPFAAFGLPTLIHNLTGSEAASQIVMNLVFVPLIYVLYAFRRLVRERHAAVRVEWGMNLFLWGLVAQSLAQILVSLLFPFQIYITSLWQPVSLVRAVLDWATIGGWTMLAAGMLELARHLLKLDGRLYGLHRPLAYALGVDGAIGLLLALLFVLTPDPEGIGTLLTLLSVIGFVMHTLITALLTLLFFRAIYRRSPRPMQTT